MSQSLLVSVSTPLKFPKLDESQSLHYIKFPSLDDSLNIEDPVDVTDLIPPQPVLVVAGEAVDHDGDGEGEDEDAAEGAQAAYQLAREGGGR